MTALEEKYLGLPMIRLGFWFEQSACASGANDVAIILGIIVTAKPQHQPNSTSTRVGSDSVISWTTQPTRPHKLNF